MRSRLSFGTSLERNAPESPTPTQTRYVHRNISRWRARGGTRSSLYGLYKRRCQGEILTNRANAELNQKWSRVNDAGLPNIAARSVSPSPLVGEGGAERRSATGEGFSHEHRPLAWRESPHPALSQPPSPTRGEGRREPQFVFATLGGAAVVMNDVASSIAGPNGVGIVMRNGTRTRVPAIGTKAISIRRSVARYLITGRSGM